MGIRLLVLALFASLGLYSCSSVVESDVEQAQNDGFETFYLDITSGETDSQDLRLLASTKVDYDLAKYLSDKENFFKLTLANLGAQGSKRQVVTYINKKNVDGTWVNVYKKTLEWSAETNIRLRYTGPIEIQKGLLTGNEELQLVAVLGPHHNERNGKLLFQPAPMMSDGLTQQVRPVVLRTTADQAEIAIPYVLKTSIVRSGSERNKFVVNAVSSKFVPQGNLVLYSYSSDYPRLFVNRILILYKELAVDYQGNVSVVNDRPQDYFPVAFFNSRGTEYPLSSVRDAEPGVGVAWFPEIAVDDIYDEESFYEGVTRGNIVLFYPKAKAQNTPIEEGELYGDIVDFK